MMGDKLLRSTRLNLGGHMNKKILVLASQFLLVVSAASAAPQQQGQNQTRPNTNPVPSNHPMKCSAAIYP